MSKYHTFDTLLLIDWLQASKGNLTGLRIENGSEIEDMEAWEAIKDEHQEHFGNDRKHISYLRLMKRLALLELDYVITEDKFITNNIEIVKEEIEQFLKEITSNSGGGISESLIALTERCGCLITETNVTAKRFFEMVRYYGKEDK